MVMLRDWQESVESITDKKTLTAAHFLSSFMCILLFIYASSRDLVDELPLCYSICAISMRVLKRYEKENFDIFESNGIYISYFRSRTRYVVLVFHVDSHIRKIYAHRKNHLVTPTLNSRHAKNKKFFKGYVICLPRESDPSKVPSTDYTLRHPLAL